MGPKHQDLVPQMVEAGEWENWDGLRPLAVAVAVVLAVAVAVLEVVLLGPPREMRLLGSYPNDGQSHAVRLSARRLRRGPQPKPI